MRAVNKFSTILALGLAMLLLRIGPAGAAAFAFEVVIATSAINTSVSSDAVMAFDFTNSDRGLEHQLVISNFAPDGALDVPTTDNPADCPLLLFPFTVDACKDPLGSSVTGTLGRNPPVIILDELPPGWPTPEFPPSPISYLHKIDLSNATFIRFRFEMSGDLTDVTSADGFAFSLLDPESGFPLVPPESETGLLVGYTFGGSCETEFPELATCTGVPSVPEPAPVALTVVALLALLGARWRAPALQRRRAVRA